MKILTLNILLLLITGVISCRDIAEAFDDGKIYTGSEFDGRYTGSYDYGTGSTSPPGGITGEETWEITIGSGIISGKINSSMGSVAVEGKVKQEGGGNFSFEGGYTTGGGGHSGYIVFTGRIVLAAMVTIKDGTWTYNGSKMGTIKGSRDS